MFGVSTTSFSAWNQTDSSSTPPAVSIHTLQWFSSRPLDGAVTPDTDTPDTLRSSAGLLLEGIGGDELGGGGWYSERR